MKQVKLDAGVAFWTSLATRNGKSIAKDSDHGSVKGFDNYGNAIVKLANGETVIVSQGDLSWKA